MKKSEIASSLITFAPRNDYTGLLRRSLHSLLAMTLFFIALPTALLAAPLQVTDLTVTNGWRRVTLNWSAPYDVPAGTVASRYEVRISTYRVLVSTFDWNNCSTSTETVDADHPNLAYRILITTATSMGFLETLTVTGLSNGSVYYFAIRSSTDNINLSGMDSASPEPVGNPQNKTPASFIHINPINDAVVFTSTPTLDWSDSDAGDPDKYQGDAINRYTVYYSTDSALLNPSIKAGVASVGDLSQSNCILPLLMENTSYYWRVRAYDTEGASKDTTFDPNNKKFIINAVNETPAAVTPLLPANTGYVLKSPSINFNWTQSSDPDLGYPGNFTYTLMFSTEGPKEISAQSFWPAISSITQNAYTFTAPSTGTLSSHTTFFLLENATYWWYVVAIDSTSLTSPALPSTYTFRFIVDRVESDPTNYYLIYPVTSTVVLTSTPTLTWTTAADADPGDFLKYKIELSSSPDIDSGSGDFATKAMGSGFPYYAEVIDYPLTSFTTGPLLENASYWWRMSVTDRLGYEQPTAAGVFIVDGINTPPSSFNLNYPANQSSTPTLKPDFDWANSSTQEPGRSLTYTIILSTSADFSAPASSSGLTASFYQPSLNLIDNATYWWKVKAVDSLLSETTSNQTTNWFIVNTATEPPNAFNLLSPANTAVTNPAKVTFDWEDSTVPDPGDSLASYEIWYSTDSNFNVKISSSGLKASSFVTFKALSNNSTYYWKVRAQGGSGSAWSSQTWTYVTSTTFNLLSPANTSYLNPLKVSLDWEDFVNPGAPGISVSYEVFFATSADFTANFSSAGLPSSVFMAPYALQNNSTYYWKVRAMLSPVEVSADSFTWCAQAGWTIFTKSTFSLLLPANGAGATYLKPTFTWTGFTDPDLTDGVLVKYELQYSIDSAFSVYGATAGINATTVSISSTLVNGQQYFWRVKAAASPAAPGANPDTYSSQQKNFFTINQAPDPFALLLPADGSIFTAAMATMTWAAATDAESDAVTYSVIYSTNPSFTVQTTSSGITGLSLPVPSNSMAENAKYYWKVEAMDVWQNLRVAGTGYFYINVTPQPPSYFDLVSPAKGSSMLNPSLLWTVAADSDPLDSVNYDLWYSTEPGFTVKTTVAGLSTTGYYINQILLGLSTYYWKVKAYGASDPASVYTWSYSTFTFYVPSFTPAVPGSFSGALNSAGTAITFSWNGVTLNNDGSNIENLAGYNLYRSRAAAGIESVLPYVSVSSSALAYEDSGFESRDYFYCVRAKNTSGVVSAISEVVYINPAPLELLNYRVFFSQDKEVSIKIPKATYDTLLNKTGSVTVSADRKMDEESVGVVHRVYDISIKQGATETKIFSDPLAIDLSYAGIISADEKTLGVSWHNGIEWIRVANEIDKTSKLLKIKTNHLSKFRIETVSEATVFTLFNWPPKAKIITPNGDGKNDTLTINYTNPQNNMFSGKIYSIAGDYMSDMTISTDLMTISWDGRDRDGFVVLPGIFIYQIKVEGAGAKVINGTTVVAR